MVAGMGSVYHTKDRRVSEMQWGRCEGCVPTNQWNGLEGLHRPWNDRHPDSNPVGGKSGWAKTVEARMMEARSCVPCISQSSATPPGLYRSTPPAPQPASPSPHWVGAQGFVPTPPTCPGCHWDLGVMCGSGRTTRQDDLTQLMDHRQKRNFCPVGPWLWIPDRCPAWP